MTRRWKDNAMAVYGLLITATVLGLPAAGAIYEFLREAMR